MTMAFGNIWQGIAIKQSCARFWLGIMRVRVVSGARLAGERLALTWRERRVLFFRRGFSAWRLLVLQRDFGHVGDIRDIRAQRQRRFIKICRALIC